MIENGGADGFPQLCDPMTMRVLTVRICIVQMRFQDCTDVLAH